MSTLHRVKAIQRFLILSGFFIVPLAAGAGPTERAGAAAGAQAPGQVMVAERMSARTSLAVEDLFAWRSRGLGWGDIEIASVVASATDQSLENVIDLWQVSNESWATVAEEYGITPLGALISEHKKGGHRGAGKSGKRL